MGRGVARKNLTSTVIHSIAAGRELQALARIDDAAALESHGAMIHAKIIGNFAVVGHIEDGEVCELANLEGTNAIVAAEGVRGIDGGSGHGFSGSHAHLCAGEGQNHRHGKSRTGAGIEVGGERHDGSSVDELARRTVSREAKMKAAAGEHGASDVGARKGANVGRG